MIARRTRGPATIIVQHINTSLRAVARIAMLTSARLPRVARLEPPIVRDDHRDSGAENVSPRCGHQLDMADRAAGRVARVASRNAWISG